MYLGYLFIFFSDQIDVVFFQKTNWHACCHERLLEKTWSPGMCTFSDANSWKFFEQIS